MIASLFLFRHGLNFDILSTGCELSFRTRNFFRFTQLVIFRVPDVLMLLDGFTLSFQCLRFKS